MTATYLQKALDLNHKSIEAMTDMVPHIIKIIDNQLVHKTSNNVRKPKKDAVRDIIVHHDFKTKSGWANFYITFTGTGVFLNRKLCSPTDVCGCGYIINRVKLGNINDDNIIECIPVLEILATINELCRDKDSIYKAFKEITEIKEKIRELKYKSSMLECLTDDYRPFVLT